LVNIKLNMRMTRNVDNGLANARSEIDRVATTSMRWQQLQQ